MNIVLFSKRLRQLRLENDFTLKSLSDAVDVTLETIYGYESAARNGEGCRYADRIRGMRVETLVKLAKVLNVSTDYLLGLEGEDHDE